MFNEIPLLELVQEFGIQGCIRQLYRALVTTKLDAKSLRDLTQARGQLRLIHEGDLSTNRLPA